ncbi:hypothetical protein A2U01_0091555, partial [Trifolium medium]|nr:hypothetical protein [Trifolium medium]
NKPPSGGLLACTTVLLAINLL